MTQNKDIWVIRIDEEIAEAKIHRIFWKFVLIFACVVFYYLNINPDFLGQRQGFIQFVLIFVVFIAFFKIVDYPRNPDYLAYYLYKIGEQIVEFENETHYLKKNQNYIENCRLQLSSQFEILSRNFTNSTLHFLNNLGHIILRLNHIYSKENIGISLMTKIEGMSSEQFITEKEFISSNLKDLANLIHKDHSILTPTHVALTSKILDELKDVPEKPIQKSLSEYAKEIWNKLPYNIKYAFCGITIFVIFFFVFYQLLIYYKQEQGSGYALTASVALTIFILRERFRDRKS